MDPLGSPGKDSETTSGGQSREASRAPPRPPAAGKPPSGTAPRATMPLETATTAERNRVSGPPRLKPVTTFKPLKEGMSRQIFEGIMKTWRRNVTHNRKCGWDEDANLTHAILAVPESLLHAAGDQHTMSDLMELLRLHYTPLLNSQDRREFRKLQIGSQTVPQFRMRVEELANRLGVSEQEACEQFIEGFERDHPELHRWMRGTMIDQTLGELAAFAQRMIEANNAEPRSAPRRLVGSAQPMDEGMWDTGTPPDSIARAPSAPKDAFEPHLQECLRSMNGGVNKLHATCEMIANWIREDRNGPMICATPDVPLPGYPGGHGPAPHAAAATAPPQWNQGVGGQPQGWGPNPAGPQYGYPSATWNRKPPPPHLQPTMQHDPAPPPPNGGSAFVPSGRTGIGATNADASNKGPRMQGDGKKYFLCLEQLPAALWNGPPPPRNQAELGRPWRVSDCQFCSEQQLPEVDPRTGQSNGHNPRYCRHLVRFIQERRPDLERHLLDSRDESAVRAYRMDKYKEPPRRDGPGDRNGNRTQGR